MLNVLELKLTIGGLKTLGDYIKSYMCSSLNINAKTGGEATEEEVSSQRFSLEVPAPPSPLEQSRLSSAAPLPPANTVTQSLC